MSGMLKKYLPFFILKISSDALWGWWALPQMGEQGTDWQTLKWMGVQALVPILFSLLLIRKQRYVLWFLLVYGSLIILYGLGTFGWAMIGPATPVAVHVVCVLFFIIGFGTVFNALQDLKLGGRRHFGLEN
jgi:hypothetical protein